jgi:hypothetical protein
MAAAMAPLGVPVVTDFLTNPHGTPVLRSMFQVLERQTDALFVGYVPRPRSTAHGGPSLRAPPPVVFVFALSCWPQVRQLRHPLLS